MSSKHPQQLPSNPEPMVLPRAKHSLSRNQIDERTLKVLYRLHHNGYQAYLVGGGVRDLLLGRTPKDFDIGTNATPQQVKRLFRNGFLVGRRFRLAHIRFGTDHVVEVATFRRQPHPDELPDDPAEHFFFVQNQFGTPREDAFRRDFTINALFYDISTYSIIDYVGGLADLEARRLRVIGDPLVRFTEDPVRMLRALEFSARLGFALDEEAREAIYARAPLIAEAAPARLREELLELFRHGVGRPVLQRAQTMGLLTPMLAGYEGDEATFKLLEQFDSKAQVIGSINEAEIIAGLFLSRFWRNCEGMSEPQTSEVLHLAGLLIAPYCGYFRISHGLRHQARELLVGCYRLARGRGYRGERRFLRHPATPGALELYRLWLMATGQDLTPVLAWQESLQHQLSVGEPVAPAAEKPQRNPRRRSRRPRRRRQNRTV